MDKHEIWVVTVPEDGGTAFVMVRISESEDPELFATVVQRAREERTKRPWGAPPRHEPAREDQG